MSTQFRFYIKRWKSGCNRFLHISWYYLQIQWFVCGCQEETCRASSKVTFCHLTKKNQKSKYTNKFATEIVWFFSRTNYSLWFRSFGVL